MTTTMSTSELMEKWWDALKKVNHREPDFELLEVIADYLASFLFRRKVNMPITTLPVTSLSYSCG